MKLDYDLIRSLLLIVEEETDGYINLSVEYFCDKLRTRNRIQIRYHLKYLLDSHFIEGTYTRDAIMDITPLGRNYLDHIHNDTIWNKTKKKLQPLGTVPLTVISQVAASCISSKLGL